MCVTRWVVSGWVCLYVGVGECRERDGESWVCVGYIGYVNNDTQTNTYIQTHTFKHSHTQIPSQTHLRPYTHRDAHALKAEGNLLYKSKDFESAIAKYKEAHALFPSDCTFLSNIAAVQLSGIKVCMCDCVCVCMLLPSTRRHCTLPQRLYIYE